MRDGFSDALVGVDGFGWLDGSSNTPFFLELYCLALVHDDTFVQSSLWCVRLVSVTGMAMGRGINSFMKISLVMNECD